MTYPWEIYLRFHVRNKYGGLEREVGLRRNETHSFAPYPELELDVGLPLLFPRIKNVLFVTEEGRFVVHSKSLRLFTEEVEDAVSKLEGLGWVRYQDGPPLSKGGKP